MKIFMDLLEAKEGKKMKKKIKEAEKKMKESKEYYAVVRAGGPIYGVGKTSEEAKNEAKEWLDRENYSELDSLSFIDDWNEWSQSVMHSSLILIEISPELAMYVNKYGGDVLYNFEDGMLLKEEKVKDQRNKIKEEVQVEETTIDKLLKSDKKASEIILEEIQTSVPLSQELGMARLRKPYDDEYPFEDMMNPDEYAEYYESCRKRKESICEEYQNSKNNS
jgi:methionine aminopeptidase